MPGQILLDQYRERDEENKAWLKELQRLLPEHTILQRKKGASTTEEREGWKDVEYVVIWTMPVEEFANLPNLRAVLVVGSGVDHLRPFDAIPMHLPIVRLVDANIPMDMAIYAMHWVIHFHISVDLMMRNQALGIWAKPPIHVPRDEFNVGVLGMGSVGSEVCRVLRSLGYKVSAWSRTARELDGVITFRGHELDKFLADVAILINILPLTDETESLIDARFLSKLPKETVLINLGRGGTIDDDALCEALDSGQLAAAVLDGFRTEPLPKDSAFWSHKKVIITPHMSGRTSGHSSAKYVAENIRRIERGEAPFPVVDRERGY